MGGGSIISQVLAIQGQTFRVILGFLVIALSERRAPTASLIGLVAGLTVTDFTAFSLPLQCSDGETFAIGWPHYGLITCAATAGVGR